jgi:hypothetical protein
VKIFIVKIDNGEFTACHAFSNPAHADEFYDKMSVHYSLVDEETYVFAPEETVVQDNVSIALLNELDGEPLQTDEAGGYCDDCGERVFMNSRYNVPILPVDITSANAGESAVLCRKCWETNICRWKETD